MKNLRIYITILLAGCLFFLTACYDELCTPGDTQECFAPDGQVTQQTCNDDGNSLSPCEGATTYSIWCDEDTDLCWQDPQKDAFNQVNNGITSFDAVRYCEELILGGYDDWRLPDITELRSIIDGNVLTENGSCGLCGIEEGSEMNNQGSMEFGIASLIPCMGKMTKQLEGPGDNGCYMKEGLTGNCDRTDPASPSHKLEFWSSTPAADDPEWVAYTFFDFAAVGFNHAQSFAEVRCVRDAPSPKVVGPLVDCVPGDTQQCQGEDGKTGSQVCTFITDDSYGWGPCDCTGFEPSPRPVDVSDQCDEIKVTVNLLTALHKQPYLLAVYLYKQGEIFMRPPDVGTFENAIFYPDIDKDKPITMTIPGCSYYKDRCMSGDYYMVVFLKMNEGIFPGMPELTDMVWVNFDTISLSGDGSSYYEFEVEAVPMLLSPIYMLLGIW
jgi:hypothetical protein